MEKISTEKMIANIISRFIIVTALWLINKYCLGLTTSAFEISIQWMVLGLVDHVINKKKGGE